MIGIRDYAPENASALLARYPDVYQTQLLTDDTEKTVAFYRSLGFERVEEMRCCAMLMVK